MQFRQVQAGTSGSSAVNYMGHLEEKTMRNSFYGTWAATSPRRKTDSKVTEEKIMTSHVKKKNKKSNILYRLQTYNSILEFPLIKPDLLFPRSLISWKSWIFPKAPLFHLSEVIRTQTIVNIQTLACAIQRPQRETRQIAPGGSWCLLCRGDYHWLTSCNKHSLKNISQIQEDHSSS